jgi:hypothetical protein
VNVSLTATDNGGSGVDKIYYTTDGSTPTTSSSVYTGSFAVGQTTTVRFFATDLAGNAESPQSQTINVDATPPTSSITCNGTTCSASSYSGSVTVGLSATDNIGGSGVDKIYYTTDGSTPTTSSSVYSGTFAVSQTTTVKFFATDLAGGAESPKSQTIVVDTTAPTSSITCNGAGCSSSFYTGPVIVTLSAVDGASGSGVDKIYFTTDGSTPTTSSTAYSGSFAVGDTATVKFFATDLAGNAESPKSQLIKIDKIAPTSSITCNGTACSSWYRAVPVTIALSATDNAGGSGVDKIYYTTNGSTPTTSSPVYTGAFTVSSTTTVKFFATDLGGLAESPKSQTIGIDTVAPTSSITCNGTTCSSLLLTHPVIVTLSATDNAGGSGVDKIYYTTDGSTPTTASAVYSGSFAVSDTTTVRFFATDMAGNAETPNSQLIKVDTIAPTSSITCNGTTCASWYRASSVTIALSATDNAGGSGLNKIYYTTNGSTPTTSSKVYTGTFSVKATTTVKFFATDLAGNAESPKSQTIGLDTTAPTSSIKCNGTTCATWYRVAPTIALSATDNAGGSGVNQIYFTTDGSTPTTASPVYTGSFVVSQTTTVRYFATDLAGNAESPKSQIVRVDAAAPTVAVTSPANGASIKRGTKLTITASASDAGTAGAPASGIAIVAFYLDGTLLGTDSSSPYTLSWNTKQVSLGNHVLTAAATDVAGNTTLSAGVNVTITP